MGCFDKLILIYQKKLFLLQEELIQLLFKLHLVNFDNFLLSEKLYFNEYFNKYSQQVLFNIFQKINLEISIEHYNN